MAKCRRIHAELDNVMLRTLQTELPELLNNMSGQ
jgi:hypothetical protein